MTSKIFHPLTVTNQNVKDRDRSLGIIDDNVILLSIIKPFDLPEGCA